MNKQTTRSEEQSKRWDSRDTWMMIMSIVLYALTFLVYKQLPEQVISKFNAAGEPSRTMGKGYFYLLYGVISVCIPLTMKLSRMMDPRKANYMKFESTFQLFRFTTTIFLHFIFWAGIAYNLGYPVSMPRIIMLALGLLWLILGNRMGQVRFNYFIGVRTPWTLANEAVWRRTHRFAGYCWVVTGILFLIGLFIPVSYSVFILIAGIILSTLVPVIYSYLIYRKLVQSS